MYLRGRKVGRGSLLVEEFKSIGRWGWIFFLVFVAETLEESMGLLWDDDVTVTIFPAQHHEEDKGLEFSPVGFVCFGDFVDEILILYDDFFVLLNQNRH